MHRLVSFVLRCILLSAANCGMSALHAGGQDEAKRDAITPRLVLGSASIPAPPQQTAVLKAAEAKLPREFVSATATLFQQGVADPRGCEYREMEVLVGYWGPLGLRGTVLKTHGWVIGDSGKQPERFGMCWNGLVYPLVSIGRAADLRTDALTAVKAEPMHIGQGGVVWSGFPTYFEDMCICNPSEIRSVSLDSPLPIKACLLLRLGEPELAEKVWSHWTSRLRSYSSKTPMLLSIEESVEANKPMLRDPYLVLANCWTLALFERALASHMRGDDCLALVSAEMLDSSWPAVKEEAEKRGFRKPSKREEYQMRYFLFEAKRGHELLVDQRRRAVERKRAIAPPVLAVDFPEPEDFTQAMTRKLEGCPSRAKRVALLVQELEEASFSCASDQILVQLLIDQGEDAVAPLLTCLESDNRLSRFQGSEERYPLGVYRFAEKALLEILKVPFHEFDEEESTRDESKHRQAVAARIRAHWKLSKSLASADGLCGVLADDQAQPYQWLAAARAIIQPTRVSVSLDSVTYGWEQDWWRPDAKRKIHGEVLRNKIKPSVAELMVKRIKALDEPYRGLLAQRKKLDEEIEGLKVQVNKFLDGPPGEYERALRRQEELEKQRDELDQQIRDDHLGWSASFLRGCDMAFCLAQWDSTAALNILREQTTLGRQAAADYGDPFKEYLTRLISVRASAGDRQATDELG